MFWRSKVFHPVWMPLEPRQRNCGTWDGPAKPIQVCIYTGIHCSSCSDPAALGLCLYGSFHLAVEQGGSILLPAAPPHPSSSPVLTSPCCGFGCCWAGSVPCSGSQLSQDCAAGTGQAAKQAGMGRTRCQQWLMLELMTLQLHPGVFYSFSPPLCNSWK